MFYSSKCSYKESDISIAVKVLPNVVCNGVVAILDTVLDDVVATGDVGRDDVGGDIMIDDVMAWPGLDSDVVVTTLGVQLKNT